MTRSRWDVFAAALVILVMVGAAAGTPTAHAAHQRAPIDLVKQRVISRNLGAMTDLLYKRSAIPTQPAVYSPEVITLHASEARPVTNAGAAKKISTDLTRLGAKVGTQPRWPATLSRLALPATAAYVGWKIGSGIHAKFLEGESPFYPLGQTEPLGSPEMRLLEEGTPFGYTPTGQEPFVAEQDSYLLHAIQEPYGERTHFLEAKGDEPCKYGYSGPSGMQEYGRYGLRCDMGAGNPLYEEGTSTSYLEPIYHPQGLFQNAPTSADGKVATLTSNPPADQGRDVYMTRVQQAIADGDVSEDVIRWVDATLNEDEGEHDPRALVVPDCHGMTVELCRAQLQNAGFDGQTTVRVATSTEADFTVDPSDVVDMNPHAGVALLEAPASVELVVNPSAAPITIPEPLPGETPNAYRDRLIGLGLATVGIILVDPGEADAPDTIKHVDPAPGTQHPPADPVTITATPGPNSTPTTGDDGGAGGCEPWVKPEIDLSPLRIHPGGTFPFGIFGWMGDGIDQWTTDNTAPSFAMPFPFVEPDPIVDFAVADDAMPILRNTILFVSTLLMIWWLATAVLGLRGDD